MSMTNFSNPSNPSETTPSLGGMAPPDSQQMTLQDHLQAALQIMSQDRVFSQDEQQAVMAFFQGVTLLAKNQGAMGQPPGNGQPQNPFGAQPGGPPQNSPVPYGQTDGSEPKPGFTQPFTGQM